MMFKEMSLRTAWRVLGASMAVIGFQAVVLCPTTFAPGWANGWPGLSKHAVFAGYLTGMLLLAQMALAIGVLALFCAGLERRVKKDYIGWSSFLILTPIIFLAALHVCSRFYPEIRDSIAKECP
jgi:hypothetical protein